MYVYNMYYVWFNYHVHNVCEIHMHTMKYRRQWLLSACAYKNEQQGKMRLIKKHVLNSKCALDRNGLDIECRAIERVRAFCVLKVSRSWKSTLSFEDITSIRLIQQELAVEPLPFRSLARTSSPQ